MREQLFLATSERAGRAGGGAAQARVAYVPTHRVVAYGLLACGLLAYGLLDREVVVGGGGRREERRQAQAS